MKIIKPDTELAVIQKWFKEIAGFISSPSLSHIEIKRKETEFIELDIFYDNHEHVFRIKFMDAVYHAAIEKIINPKPLFHRELRPDEIEALANLTQRINLGQPISAT